MKFLQEYPKCPNCGAELERDETTNWYDEGDEIFLQVEGTCPNCRKGFSWEEKFAYITFSDLEGED